LNAITTAISDQLFDYSGNFKKLSQSNPFFNSQSVEYTDLPLKADFLRLLVEIAYYRYPNNLKQRTKLLIRNLIWYRETVEWYRQISCSPLLSTLVINHKGLIDKPFKRYLRLGFSAKERLKNILDHYAIFTDSFDPLFIHQALFDKGINLGRIETSTKEVYELTLSISEDECKEGELAISFHKPNEAYLSIARFSLLSNNGEVKLFISAIQGPKGVQSKKMVHDACKSLYGLTPNRIVIESCLAFASFLNIKQIEFVSDKNQVFKNKHNKHFSYDHFCEGLGGKLNSKEDYLLPQFINRKKREDTPSKRRAKYQHQHSILDSVFVNVLNYLKTETKVLP